MRITCLTPVNSRPVEASDKLPKYDHNSGLRNYLVTEPVLYKFHLNEEDALVLTIPAGFYSDFLSIPKPVAYILSPTDPKGKHAALLHDFLYTTQGKMVVTSWKKGVFQRVEHYAYGRAWCDDCFLKVLMDRGYSTPLALLFWGIIRLMGARVWEDTSA